MTSSSRRDPELVSTIIPVHNRARLLREAVASVLAQTYRPIEIVIVDDGSTDDTAAVADELARSSPETIVVIHQPNGGPGAARQRGLERARGSFIQFLDSDDLLLPGKFTAQVGALRRQPDCQISYGPSLEENHAIQPVRRPAGAERLRDGRAPRPAARSLPPHVGRAGAGSAARHAAGLPAAPAVDLSAEALPF
jgi:glycosyltransferase involved in cell wall biosynthesis